MKSIPSCAKWLSDEDSRSAVEKESIKGTRQEVSWKHKRDGEETERAGGKDPKGGDALKVAMAKAGFLPTLKIYSPPRSRYM